MEVEKNKFNEDYMLYCKHWIKYIYAYYICYTFILLSYWLIFSNFISINILIFLHKYIYYMVFISEGCYLLYLGWKISLLDNEKIEKVKTNYISKNKDFVGMDKINVNKLLSTQWIFAFVFSLLLLLVSSAFYGVIYKNKTNEFAELKITNSKQICISNPNFNYKEVKNGVDIYVSYIIEKNEINTPLDSKLYNHYIKQMINVDDSILTNNPYNHFDYLKELNKKMKIVNDNIHNQQKKIFCKK